MTPRRPLRYAVSLVVGGTAAIALVGCGNGMQVAGPSTPHESVVSARPTPSAAAPSSAASPDQSPSSSADRTDGNDSTGPESGNGGSDDQPKTSDDSRKRSGGSQDSKKSGDDGRGSTGPDTKSGAGADGTSEKGTKDKTGDEPTTAPSDQASDKPRAVATCALDDLSVGARIPEGSGAAGSSYVLITFTNTSGRPCVMYGYAGVSFVGNKDGTQLGKPAAREKSASPEKIKLSDGEVQTELLRITNAGNFDAADCVPTTSDGFRIYPPSSYTSAFVKFETDACQSKSVRQLTVYPVGTKG